MTRGKDAKDLCQWTGKVCHPTKGEAIRHMRYAVNRRRSVKRGMYVYRCGHCGLWHLGSKWPGE